MDEETRVSPFHKLRDMKEYDRIKRPEDYPTISDLYVIKEKQPIPQLEPKLVHRYFNPWNLPFIPPEV